MACRISHIKRVSCSYNVEGVNAVKLLDIEDFEGFKFEDDRLYDVCKVVRISVSGDWVDVEIPDTAKYNSTLGGNVYTHTIETFIGELSAELSAVLHLATKRRSLVLFKTNMGRYFIFGSDAGATLSYTSQTAEATGSLVTISASSKLPLFEVLAGALLTPVLGVSNTLPILTEDFKNYILIY